MQRDRPFESVRCCRMFVRRQICLPEELCGSRNILTATAIFLRTSDEKGNSSDQLSERRRAHRHRVETQVKILPRSNRKVIMGNVTSDEALWLLRNMASGRSVPKLRNPYQFWTDETVDVM